MLIEYDLYASLLKTRGEHIRFSNLKEETINHVFNSYLNREILDFDVPLSIYK